MESPLVGSADLYRLVKLFDFDERDDGNFESQPMHWVKLKGPGLPFDAVGKFDHKHGHPAAPSFKLEFSLDNVAYEYQKADLTVEPESDYFVSAYAQVENLSHARAFIGAYLVDRFGDRIPGSARISNMVGSVSVEASQEQPWQRLELNMVGDYPDAYAMRLQLWVLQPYVWQEPPSGAIDPIVKRDRLGIARFDDIRIHRLPRARLRFSSPAGLVRAGAREAFLLEVNNATTQPLQAGLAVTDVQGIIRHTHTMEVPSRFSSAARRVAGHAPSAPDRAVLELPIPDLPPGVYEAALTLRADEDVLLERHKRFAILPPLPPRGPPFLDLGVDLGRWRRGDVAGVRDLLDELHCGAVKVGVPMIGALNTAERGSYFEELTQLLRVLAQDRIDTVGVILTQSAAVDPRGGEPTSRLVQRENWPRFMQQILAHFGGLLSTWQVGDEAVELRGARWTAAQISEVRRQLQRHMTLPEIAVPTDIAVDVEPVGDAAAYWVPAAVPAAAFARQLDFLAAPAGKPRWLHLESPHEHIDRLTRLQMLGQRLILAKALGPDRVYVPAPFELSQRAGVLSWEPTEDFIVLRTLFHELSGKSAIGAIVPDEHSVAIIFSGGGRSCVAVWTWRDEPREEPLELYLGHQPQLLDLWGAAEPLELVEGRAQVPVRPMPHIVTNVDTALALLQSSFRVTPTYLQIHTQDPLTVTFQNHFDQRATGEIRLLPPEDWQFDPDLATFELAPGAKFMESFGVAMPQRQLAAKRTVRVELRLFTPKSEKLVFDVPIHVGLPDIAMDAVARWDGDTLVVLQSLRNMSSEAVSFDGFLAAPGFPRQQQFFLEVAPGELREVEYVLPGAKSLAEDQLLLGIKEIRGARTLDTVIPAPPHAG